MRVGTILKLIGAGLFVWLVYALWQAVTMGTFNKIEHALNEGWRSAECRINPYECTRRF